MNWYLVFTKPMQELRAFDNLIAQGYECHLPMFPVEKVKKGSLTVAQKPLFPRYLFIRLGCSDLAKSSGPIRSTKGVSRLVSFGGEPARVDDNLIGQLRIQETAFQVKPVRLFVSGECVQITETAFLGIKDIYKNSDGERRAMVLIEILSKSVLTSVKLGNLRKAN